MPLTDAITKYRRPALVVLGIAVIFWILYLLRAAILPFAFGVVLAYLLSPIVSWLEKLLPPRNKWAEARRAFSIIIIFLILAGLTALFSYYLVTAVFDSFTIILHNAPYFIAQSVQRIQQWFEILAQQLPPEIRQQVNQALVDAGAALGNNIRDALVRGFHFTPRTMGTILGFAALPFFLFYTLKDSARLKNSLFTAFPPATAEIVRDIVSILERVLGQYIRAQVLLGLIVAYFSFVGLIILQVQFAPVLATVAGITEVIPTLGPWIGGGIAVIITLALTPDKVIWVAVLFLIVQLVENNFLVPRIQSAYLHIHPAVMIVLLVVGAYIAGIWGLLLAAPLTATVMEIYKYLRHRFPTETGQNKEGIT